MPKLKRASRRGPEYYEFPYVKLHGKFYPLIPIRLRRGAASVNTFALLDSGATISVFRPEIAKALKIRPHHHEALTLASANGGVDIAVAKIRLKVGGTQFESKIGFSAAHAVNFNILGREGVFHRFSICFNEIMRTVVMVPLSSLRNKR